MPVVLVPRELSVFPVMLAKFIAEQSLTVWYSVPSALTALVLRGRLSLRSWEKGIISTPVLL